MSEELVSIRFHANGEQHETQVEPRELLIDFLRERLGLTGTKRSCDMEVCGTCTVLLEEKAVSSCSLFAFELDGKNLTTIEGLERADGLHPLQRAFITCGGFQCGFCTPGMILLAKSLLTENPNPTSEQVCAYMDANICRCTGYQMIVESILHAAKEMQAANR
jgi:carbon-monoxide dehydrogenase small subunit